MAEGPPLDPFLDEANLHGAPLRRTPYASTGGGGKPGWVLYPLGDGNI